MPPPLTSEQVFGYTLTLDGPLLPRIGSVPVHHRISAPDPITALDAAHASVSSSERTLFAAIARLDPECDWEQWGARDEAHWLAMRLDVSEWKARRWICAAHALERLPRLAAALASADLGLDKVVELARFATPETEAGLIRWAQMHSCAAVRHRGDRELRPTPIEVADIQGSRSLSWWTVDEGRQLGLSAQLPAADGAVVVRAISRLSRHVPVMPGEHPEWSIEQRRADALVALCSASIAADPDRDRATVVVHTTFDDLRTGGNGETEGDGVIPGLTLRRLLCTARVQTVVEDASGTAVGVGRMTRVVPAWLHRQIRHRDHECRFPACGARAFTEAHHITWWRNGGRTDLDNLVLLCSFHHRLVHEHGWSLHMRSAGLVDWFDTRGGAFVGRPTRTSDSPLPATEVDHPARSPGRRSAA